MSNAKLLNILVNFSAFGIYVFLTVYILRKNPKERLNRLCAAIFVCFATYSFGQMMLQNAVSMESVRFWDIVASLGWCSFPAFAIIFGLYLAQKDRLYKNIFIYLGLGLLTCFFIYQQIAGNLIVDYVEMPYGWNVVWARSGVSVAFSIYYVSVVLVCAYLVFDAMITAENLRKKKGAKTLLITLLIALPIGFLNVSVLPSLGIYTLPQLGNVATLIWAVGLIYAVERYGLLTLAPKYATAEILSIMSDALVLFNMEGEIIFPNRAAMEMLGYSNEELEELDFDSLFGYAKPLGLDKEAFFQAILNEKTIRDINVRCKKRDGVTIPVLFSASLVEIEGEPTGVAATLHDLSAYEAVTHDLRVSEERYRTLVENALVGIGIHQDNKIVYANPVLSDMLGYSIEESLGQSISEFIIPEERELILRRATKRQEGSKEPIIYEITLMKKDGTPLNALISNAVIEYDGKKATMFTISDITDTKARRGLEIANKELEAFSYSVSHDLRAPLRSIRGFSQALLEDYGDVLDERGRDYLTRVIRATERMSQIIDDLLDLSRFSQRKLNYGIVNLSAIVKDIVNELSEKYGQRKVDVKIADGLVAECDGALVRIVLENLLDNAWKFTANREQAVIQFGAIEKEGETVYFVQDNGVGFDMEYSEKLFNPFQRLHGEEFEGTGIGLATVARIIHRHGGRIWAHGTPGVGATFYFTLAPFGREADGGKQDSV